MTTNFKDRVTWLEFNEYLDKNSVKNAWSVSPATSEALEVQFRGRRLKFIWPENLSSDRTYILSIGRELKDEHGVHLDRPIQVAYGTGSKIDRGRIAGKIHGGRNVTVYLWQLSNRMNTDSLVFSTPDFTTQASGNNEYAFEFLPADKYRLAAFDGLTPSTSADLSRLRFGIPGVPEIEVSDSLAVEGIDLILMPKDLPLEILRLGSSGKNWGTIEFSRKLLSEEMAGIDLEIPRLNRRDITTFISGIDSSALVFYLDSLTVSTGDSVTVTLRDTAYLSSARFNLDNDYSADTLKPELIPFEKGYDLNVNDDEYQPVNIFTDRPVDEYRNPGYTARLFRDDTISIPNKVTMPNPMWIRVTSGVAFIPETQYRLLLIRDSREGKADTTIFSFKTSSITGRGNLEGLTGFPERENLLVEIRNTENSDTVFRNYVNSSSRFLFENIEEGKYTLLLFEDRDKNGQYSNGSLFPFSSGEWFHVHPDTIEIRGNWTIQTDVK